MFKFAELDKSICLTCQYFKGKRKVEVIGRKMFIDYEKDKGNCRLFNDFPVIITIKAGHCDWCQYKRWNHLPAIKKPTSSAPPSNQKQPSPPKRSSFSCKPHMERHSSHSVDAHEPSSSTYSDETVYETVPSRHRGGCLWRIIKLAILVGIGWWLYQKFNLTSLLQPYIEKLKTLFS